LTVFGVVTGAVVAVASWVPVLGALLLGALAPLFLGSACLVLDDIARQGKTARSPRGLAVLRAGAQSLVRVLDKEARLIPLMLFGIYGLAVVLLALILMFSVRLAVGTGLLGGVLGALPVLALLVVLFGSVAYALPLAFLRDEAVGTAILLSARVALHHIYAVLMLLGLLALPAVLGALSALYSPWIAYAVGIVASALAFPWTVAALYCSFRTLFATDAAGVKAAAPQRAAPSAAR
jgi:hypothetical protein